MRDLSCVMRARLEDGEALIIYDKAAYKAYNPDNTECRGAILTTRRLSVLVSIRAFWTQSDIP